MGDTQVGTGSRDLFGFIRTATEAMQRVALIRNGAAWGTGCLVGEDLVLTNRHVLESGSLKDYDLVFDYVQANTDLSNLPKYAIKESLDRKPKEELDYELIRLDRKLNAERGFFRLSPERPSGPGKVKITLFGFPHENGKLQPLQFMPGEITTYINQPAIKRIGYSAETNTGSSGSPIIGLSGDAIGLHHWGQRDFENFGIPMFAILDAMPASIRSLLSIAPATGSTSIPTRSGGMQSMEEFQAEVSAISDRVVPSEPMRARAALLNRLGALNEVQFNQVLVLLNADRPRHDQASGSVGESGPVNERVPKLLNWLGTPGRPDNEQLLVALELLGYGTS